VTKDAIVVVGASAAGIHAAEAVRGAGFDGSLVVVGAESVAAYQRPALSKQMLMKGWNGAALPLRSADQLAALQAEWVLGRTATGLDTGACTVHLDDGTVIRYSGLIIATGSRAVVPSWLPGVELEGVDVLRTLDDALSLRRVLASAGRHLTVIGAGFIGSEVASAARQMGASVALVDPRPSPLAGALGAVIGGLVAELHKEQGVDLRCGVGVQAILGSNRVEGVRLSDGRTIETDAVVLGLGVRPNADWLHGSGVRVDDGVVCDPFCASSVPGIYAAGDVARWPNIPFDSHKRVEHWSNAAQQGEAAGRNLVRAADPVPYASVPYFWSDQYTTKVQLLGVCSPDDSIVLLSGSMEERRFVAAFERHGTVRAVVAFNQPRMLAPFYELLRQGPFALTEAFAAVKNLGTVSGHAIPQLHAGAAVTDEPRLRASHQ
jgi:3-phenylpropionate/trans-cinnamate dioxygenase ferredoxin reductase subunit